MQDLIQIFKNINIRDIVDMAIIAFVFYNYICLSVKQELNNLLRYFNVVHNSIK